MAKETLDQAAESSTSSREALLSDYERVRSQSEALAAPLTPEDAQIQSMPDVSPTKWHLGHTTWFFETFLLGRSKEYRPAREEYKVLFNSYYDTIGKQHPRPNRGWLSRPSLEEVYDYRDTVDSALRRLLDGEHDVGLREIAPLVRLGLHHEQQHQELMVTDILHVFWSNPLRPAYREEPAPSAGKSAPLVWHSFPEGIHWIGYEGDGFSFDNETPRHRQFVHAFDLASRPVTAGEYIKFLTEGGYRRPDLWLSDGFATVQQQEWTAPLYWERRGGTWWHMTLRGMEPVDPNAPVCHVSYYEADAYARFRGARLPTEAEWEVAATEGNGCLSPVWEWTWSAYLPYPGYRPGAGALGEYNGKFMCNQMVLRGGSFATPSGHLRPTYRNFFPPEARWQFAGIRLAKDA